MNPKHHEFLGPDRMADLRRSAAGHQRMARAKADARPVTSIGDRIGWSARARRRHLLRLSDLIVRVIWG